MAFLIGGANSATGDFINNSLRFNDGDTASLSRSFGSSGNNKTFTFSCWVKFADRKTGSSASDCCHGIFASEEDTGYQFFITTDENQILRIADYQSEYKLHLQTNRRFTDCTAWYHLVVIFDTTQGTAADRCKVYINGQKQTSFSTAVYPDQNQDLYGNENNTHYIGRRGGSNTMHFDGYIAEVHFVDGTAVAATSFGEVNDNGVWVPIEYTGSHGTQGFYLQFKQTGTSANASGIGADTSGNGLHFTCTNLAATDISTDTPQNSFATLNPLNKFGSPVTHEGNLEYDSNSSSGSSLVSSIAPSNGKWYVEVKALTSTIHIGVSEVGLDSFRSKGQGASRPNINYQYGGGEEFDGSNVDSEATFTTNDIIGFALNLDDGELIIYKNGTAINSGTAYNLHTNTTHGNTGFSVQTATGSGNTKASFNFGSPAFAISSGNSDANGYGNFEYAVPSGYYALCTKNLAEYG